MKGILIPIAIIALLLLSGCLPVRQKQQVQTYNIGTEGITVALLKDIPPDTIWAGSDFTIAVEVRNKGAYTVNDALITISGFDDRYIAPAQSEQSTGELFGKSPSYPEGDVKIIQFNHKNVNLPEREEHDETFKATAEYNYQTIATAEVCINPEIYGFVKTKMPCEVKELQLVGGQGAPIAVTRIEQKIQILENTIIAGFDIFIANKGLGVLLSPIKISDAKIGEKPLKCTPTELILKEKEESKIRCEAAFDRAFGAYTTPLTLKLNYKYASSIYKKIKVTK